MAFGTGRTSAIRVRTDLHLMKERKMSNSDFRPTKAEDARLRRLASTQGLGLSWSRRRGGYLVFDREGDFAVAGGDVSLSPKQVESWLTS